MNVYQAPKEDEFSARMSRYREVSSLKNSLLGYLLIFAFGVGGISSWTLTAMWTPTAAFVVSTGATLIALFARLFIMRKINKLTGHQ